MNDNPDFNLYVDRAINQLSSSPDFELQVGTRAERYAQLIVDQDENPFLKLEFVNDVPSHIGAISDHPALGRLDSIENILANKVTAVLSREEPKDLADIWAICTKYRLSLQQALADADSKAAGIFPADLARVLLSVNEKDWEVINWIDPPKPELCFGTSPAGRRLDFGGIRSGQIKNSPPGVNVVLQDVLIFGDQNILIDRGVPHDQSVENGSRVQVTLIAWLTTELKSFSQT